MNKLLYLKDLDVCDECKDQVRQAAIKLANYLNKNLFDETNTMPKDEEVVSQLNGMVLVFEGFFNISEEDLE